MIRGAAGVRLAAAAVVVAALVCAGCTVGGPAPASTSATAAQACAPRVVDGTLPVWAQAGFHPPTQAMHYELGQAGGIAAILWQYPLLSPPSQQVANKILWVSRLPQNPGSPLVIEAQRMVAGKQAGAPVRRQVMGGPGPSYVNLPAAGCWRLNLSWSGRHDTLDVDYVPGG